MPAFRQLERTLADVKKQAGCFLARSATYSDIENGRLLDRRVANTVRGTLLLMCVPEAALFCVESAFAGTSSSDNELDKTAWNTADAERRASLLVLASAETTKVSRALWLQYACNQP